MKHYITLLALLLFAIWGFQLPKGDRVGETQPIALEDSLFYQQAELEARYGFVIVVLIVIIIGLAIALYRARRVDPK